MTVLVWEKSSKKLVMVSQGYNQYAVGDSSYFHNIQTTWKTQLVGYSKETSYNTTITLRNSLMGIDYDLNLRTHFAVVLI